MLSAGGGARWGRGSMLFMGWEERGVGRGILRARA